MSCPPLSTLQAHVEGFATPDEREAIVAHLERCAICRELVLAMPVDSPRSPRRFDSDDAFDEHEPAGRRIDRYVTLGRIGQGGMGVVYAAYDPELDRKIAIKLIRPPLGDEATDKMQERLLREAQAMARVAHRNVAAVYDVGRHGDQVFVAMELVAGEPLGTWLARAPRSTEAIVRAFLLAGRGLAAAHAAGLVHRDFTPANVMIDDRGEVRVLDFGLARPVGAHDDRSVAAPSPSRLDRPLTASGTLLGTPAYMAPEQLAREPADARTDQFGYCVALYEALCGTRPFVAADTDELRATILERRRQRPLRSAPAHLLRAVERGLEPSRDARWPTMDALLDELSRDPWRKRKRWLAAAAIVVAVATPAATLMAMSHERARSCDGRAATVDAVWNAARRQAIHDAFIATGRRDAVSIFTATTRQLDDYAARWSAMTASTCRDPVPDELSRLRDACLDGRLAELRSLVGVFARADSDVVGRAVKAAGGLSSAADCGDAAALRRDEALPADPAARREVLALHSKLAELKAEDLVGHYRQMLDEAKTIEARVTALHHRPTEARLRLVQGIAAVNNDDFDAARAFGRQAVLAAEACGSTTVALDAWRLLLRVATEQAAGDAADEAFQHAEALIERVGDERERPLLLIMHGESLGARGRADEAVATEREALRLAERANNADLTNQATAALAAVLDLAGKPDEARGYYERSIAAVEKASGDKSLEAATARSNFGTMLLGIGELSAARAQLERVLAVEEDVLGANHVEVGRTLSTLAEVALSDWRYGDADRLARRALATLEKKLAPGDSLLAFPLATLGKLALARNRPADAIAVLERAVSLYEGVDASPTDLGVARCTLGEALIESGTDRARGKRLLTAARAAFVAHHVEPELTQLNTWQAQHGLR